MSGVWKDIAIDVIDAIKWLAFGRALLIALFLRKCSFYIYYVEEKETYIKIKINKWNHVLMNFLLKELTDQKLGWQFTERCRIEALFSNMLTLTLFFHERMLAHLTEVSLLLCYKCYCINVSLEVTICVEINFRSAINFLISLFCPRHEFVPLVNSISFPVEHLWFILFIIYCISKTCEHLQSFLKYC